MPSSSRRRIDAGAGELRLEPTESGSDRGRVDCVSDWSATSEEVTEAGAEVTGGAASPAPPRAMRPRFRRSRSAPTASGRDLRRVVDSQLSGREVDACGRCRRRSGPSGHCSWRSPTATALPVRAMNRARQADRSGRGRGGIEAAGLARSSEVSFRSFVNPDGSQLPRRCGRLQLRTPGVETARRWQGPVRSRQGERSSCRRVRGEVGARGAPHGYHRRRRTGRPARRHRAPELAGQPVR